jgi:hypothetical protein
LRGFNFWDDTVFLHLLSHYTVNESTCNFSNFLWILRRPATLQGVFVTLDPVSLLCWSSIVY